MSKIAVFASGSGTNAENIFRYFSSSKSAEVTLILTENPKAFVIDRAKKLGVPCHIFTVEELKKGLVTRLLKDNKIDLVVLAGFLRLIPEDLINAFPNRILNIHPALLPKFGGKGMYGMRVHKAVVDSGESETGITIHLVNEEYDSGDILFQARCPILPCDEPETVAERVHALEYQYYPEVIKKFILEKLG
jgi:phosphoribosylglycinamide formyltransferase 1